MQQSMSKRAYWQRYFASQTWKVKLISHSVKHKFGWKAKMRFLQLDMNNRPIVIFPEGKIPFFRFFHVIIFSPNLFIEYDRLIDSIWLQQIKNSFLCRQIEYTFLFRMMQTYIYRNSSVQYQHHIICFMSCQHHSRYDTSIWFLSQHHRLFSSKYLT
jgi:hypothetical protein